MNLEQKNKPYEAPKKAFTAFTGTGRSMAEPASASSSSPAAAPAAPAATKGHEVDPNKPTTSLQIRLADGTRLQARFNLDHTVNDIRQFINRSQPQQQRNYDIITTMPRQVYSDGNQTIQDAGLANSAVVQHLV